MNYTNQIIIAFEEIMKYEFPEIKNLKVTRGEDANFVISFDEGIYTKEEVFSKLDEIRSYGKGLSMESFNSRTGLEIISPSKTGYITYTATSYKSNCRMRNAVWIIKKKIALRNKIIVSLASILFSVGMVKICYIGVIYLNRFAMNIFLPILCAEIIIIYVLVLKSYLPTNPIYIRFKHRSIWY